MAIGITQELVDNVVEMAGGRESEIIRLRELRQSIYAHEVVRAAQLLSSSVSAVHVASLLGLSSPNVKQFELIRKTSKEIDEALENGKETVDLIVVVDGRKWLISDVETDITRKS